MGSHLSCSHHQLRWTRRALPRTCVTRAKLQRPGTAKENNKTQNTYKKKTTGCRKDITYQAPGTNEKAADESSRTTPTSTSALHAASTTKPGQHHTKPCRVIFRVLSANAIQFTSHAGPPAQLHRHHPQQRRHAAASSRGCPSSCVSSGQPWTDVRRQRVNEWCGDVHRAKKASCLLRSFGTC